MKPETKYILMGAAVLVAIGLILVFVPGDPASTQSALNKLKIATGFTLLALIFLLGFAVLVAIANGTIDLTGLLSETGGAGDSKGASLSRLQLLIFTLVIALSLFLVTVAKMDFPAIPADILTLLGISASTYAVSKGIQAGSQSSGGTQQAASPPPGGQGAATGAGQALAAGAAAGAGGAAAQAAGAVGDRGANA
jgi:hypothetical protein